MRRKPDDHSATQLIPLGNHVLVHPLPPRERQGKVQVIVTETAASRAQVLAVGPDVWDVHVGQLVLISRLQGVEVGGEILLRESAVLAYL